VTSPLEEQAQAAVTDARHIVEELLGIDHAHPKQGTSALFEALWSAHEADPWCAHLRARPIQPAFLMLLPPLAWRCRPCLGEFAKAQRGTNLGLIEEFTCDHCRRYVRTQLTPTVVRQDLWTIILAVCHRCERLIMKQGGRVIEPRSDEPT
jgi:hypothetical protein